MIDCALDGGDPAISADDGLMVVAMIEAAERSIREKAPIQVSSMLGAAVQI
jgi:predicted dehydrogenase